MRLGLPPGSRVFHGLLLHYEVTFAESRRHLGTVLFALFSIVTARRTVLIADRLQRHQPLPLQHSARYRKPQPTFADALAAVRRAVRLSPGSNSRSKTS